jgi:hypothetical protein
MKAKNLTAYHANHLQIKSNPRTLLADKGRKKIEAETWERTLPNIVSKPKSIEEQVSVGYRKRMNGSDLATYKLDGTFNPPSGSRE